MGSSIWTPMEGSNLLDQFRGVFNYTILRLSVIIFNKLSQQVIVTISHFWLLKLALDSKQRLWDSISTLTKYDHMLWWILVISGEWRRPIGHILERNSSDHLNNTIIENLINNNQVLLHWKLIGIALGYSIGFV